VHFPLLEVAKDHALYFSSLIADGNVGVDPSKVNAFRPLVDLYKRDDVDPEEQVLAVQSLAQLAAHPGIIISALYRPFSAPLWPLFFIVHSQRKTCRFCNSLRILKGPCSLETRKNRGRNNFQLDCFVKITTLLRNTTKPTPAYYVRFAHAHLHL